MHTMTFPATTVLDGDLGMTGGWRRRGVAAVAVVVLLLLVVQGWMPQVLIPDGSGTAAAPASQSQQDPSVDLDAIVERGRYGLDPVPGRPGALEVVGDRYRVEFDQAGFSYAPTGSTEPLAISLSDITRGGREIAVGREAWTADANVARRVVADGVHEQVTARKGEVEWDLVLAERPAGRGDLFVGADLSGVVGAPTRSGAGWELPVANGQTVEMGEIVVIDAEDRVLHRGRPTIDDGQVGLLVPDEVLQDAVYPLTVDPTVGGRIVAAAGKLAPDHSGVAFNGTDFLVVWHEYVQDTSPAYDVRGVRVSGDGQSVFGQFTISPNTGNFAWYPEVVWTGTHFLVVWERRINDVDLDVHGQRVGSSDNLIGTRLLIANASTTQSRPTVTSVGNGTGYVVWQDNKNGNGFDIFGARVNADGGLPDPGGRAVAVTSFQETRPDVAWNGGTYLVAFERQTTSTDYDVQAQLVDVVGAPTGGRISVSVVTGIREELPAVASDGSQYLVVWQDSHGGGDVWGRRVDSNGATPASVFPVAFSGNLQGDPTVAYHGVYLVAWSEQVSGGTAVRAARVNRNGELLDSSGFTVRGPGESNAYSPAASRGAGNEKWAVSFTFGGSIEARLVSAK